MPFPLISVRRAIRALSMQPLGSGAFILRIGGRNNSSRCGSVPHSGLAGEGYPRPTVLVFKIHNSVTTALFTNGPAPGHMEAALQFVSRYSSVTCILHGQRFTSFIRSTFLFMLILRN